MSALSAREQAELLRAAGSGAPAVVFVHGPWLLASSWDRWRTLFEERGYVTLAPSWPDDPETVEEARLHPELFAHKKVQQVCAHVADVLRELDGAPALVGHSLGGLVVQQLAGEGLAAATVAIAPAPFRGVIPLPLSALEAALPVLGNPANYRRAVALTYEQFRSAFANAATEEEARALHETYAVAASGAPLFQAAAASVNPWTRARVDTANPDRGPLLVVSGRQDHIVPWAIAHGSYQRQRRNPGITELHEVADRGHSLTIDGGWRDVAGVALAFVERHHPPRAGASPEPPIAPAERGPPRAPGP